MPSLAKVLLLVENNSYPFDVRVRREALALRDAGYQVAVVSPRKEGQPTREVVDGVHVYRFPNPPQGNGLGGYILEFGYATTIMLIYTFWVWFTHGIDVIHAANPPDTLFVVGMAFKLFGKKFIFDHHDLSPETYQSRFKEPTENMVYKVLLWLERCSYAVADRVIVTNESYRAIAMKRGKKKAEHIFIVRNGPDPSFQLVDPDSALSQKAAHIVGYIGTMGPQDGVDYWLRAMYEMVYTLKRTDFYSVIIGSGDAITDLQKLAKELNIEPYVWFTGRIPYADVLRYLSTAHICIHPDPFNPLNDRSTMNKMMEYMALRKPVVSFDLVEARFSAQDAALYAKANDTLDFAQKVIWLMDHPEARVEMGARGQERVRTQLAWEYSVPHLLAAYSSLE